MNYIGIDIGGTNLKAGLVDDRGTVLATKKVKIAQINNADALAWAMVIYHINRRKDIKSQDHLNICTKRV